ncbi:TetR/AcrR family transcriptional regulator [Skermania piniformis]
MDAVAELLQTVPIADLSVARIAEHAGVTRPAFYFYFDSKYTVAAAALQQVWQDLEESTAALDEYDFAVPPAEFSDRMINDAVVVWRRHARLLAVCAQSTDPGLTTAWDRFVDDLTLRLTRFVERVDAAEGVRPVSADLPALVDSLVGATIWALLDETRRPRPDYDERRLTAVRRLWLAGVWGAETNSPGA